MGSLANQTEQETLNYWFGDTVPKIPVTYYLGLSTTAPADDGTNITEPASNGYTRVDITNNTTNFCRTFFRTAVEGSDGFSAEYDDGNHPILNVAAAGTLTISLD